MSKRSMMEGEHYMRVRISTLLIIVISLLFCAQPISAGGQRWSAWVYDQTHGQLTLVSDTSASSPTLLDLPLAPGYTTFSPDVAISHDWTYLAYIISNPATNAQALAIFNRNANKLAFTFPYPATARVTLDLAGDENVYNETNTMLAFGYTPDENSWEVRTLNLGDMSFGPSLRHDSPVVAANHIQSQFIGPVIRQFRGDEISFAMVHLASEGSDRYPAYTWNKAANTLKVNAAYTSLGTDTLLTTGETITAQTDSRFPACSNCSPFYSPNALMVYDPTTNSVFPFYTRAQIERCMPPILSRTASASW
jgi:hypothetical protein